ncbi:murein hydrolase activator EnvC family protein [Luteimonas notoginsengisoli]|uniref:Murein hydrolase activator EnvC family protein n=1 Tax=Luteimonas notoginsengisoli TaxID=1578200 RepID=A0ABV7UWW9_9GAMM
MRAVHRPGWWSAVVLAGVLGAAVVPAQAQSSRDAQRKLEKVNRELKQVAAERRKIEEKRGDASRQLRQVDEKVGTSVRSLRETEAELARQQATLAGLRDQRDALQGSLAAQRRELGDLLRAAYVIGDDAPLKLMLAQDKVAEASRALAYHRYLQRDRTARIATLTAQLAELERVEREIGERQAALDAAKARQREQLAEFERDRRERSATVAQLDKRYQDRADREKALGRDAKSLQKLLAQLRAAAAKAAAERRAAAAAAAAAERAKREGGSAPEHKRRPPPIDVAKTAPIQVGGLGWPVSGTLVAGYGAAMPDGHKSSGVLIGAPAGTTVKAVADGTVVFSEWMTGYGLILIVDHGNGYMSLYAYNDALLKDAGARVSRGDPVASVGNSGGQGRPALYFELRRNGSPVNPNSWLQKR